ncbi:hypothetical protein F5Y14DRAFT_287226 [Nemania sp. NC0429]|nr:hypothetical protein F5Y14DRAFT_287226 [Nemania sp. NC0429]
MILSTVPTALLVSISIFFLSSSSSSSLSSSLSFLNDSLWVVGSVLLTFSSLSLPLPLPDLVGHWDMKNRVLDCRLFPSLEKEKKTSHRLPPPSSALLPTSNSLVRAQQEPAPAWSSLPLSSQYAALIASRKVQSSLCVRFFTYEQ